MAPFIFRQGLLIHDQSQGHIFLQNEEAPPKSKHQHPTKPPQSELILKKGISEFQICDEQLNSGRAPLSDVVRANHQLGNHYFSPLALFAIH